MKNKKFKIMSLSDKYQNLLTSRNLPSGEIEAIYTDTLNTGYLVTVGGRTRELSRLDMFRYLPGGIPELVSLLESAYLEKLLKKNQETKTKGRSL